MIYTYQNPNTGETIDVSQGMNDEHIYIDENGLKWDRVFYSPQISIDAKLDPFSQRQFMEKTNKRGTYGDLIDRSKELSDQRAAINGGIDPQKVEYEKQYAKVRGGRKPLKTMDEATVNL